LKPRQLWGAKGLRVGTDVLGGGEVKKKEGDLGGAGEGLGGKKLNPADPILKEEKGNVPRDQCGNSSEAETRPTPGIL